MQKLSIIFAVTLLFFAAISCNRGAKNESNAKKVIDQELEVNEELVDDFNTAKKVFYALPSPVETAMLIKRAGTEYDSEILNQTSKVELYTNSLSRALNFGVYGADLCYASLFEQTQTAIEYMNVSRKLADDMGILEYMNIKLMIRLENNINNRDSSMQIITDGFMASNAYLTENGRPEVAALIIAGGWIEGLYLATQLTRSSPNNNELIDRIIDQKLSLNILVNLLENYSNNKDVSVILKYLSLIYNIYNEINVVTSKVEPTTDKDTKVTTLQAKTEIFISDKVFNNLCNTVDSIRTIIVE